MSRIKDEFGPYLDSIGLIQNGPNRLSGNGLLYTAHFLLLAQDWLTFEEKEAFRAAYQACQIEPGYYRRHPDAFQNDQESLDDYIGVGTAGMFLGLPFASECLRYGQRKKKVFPGIYVKYYYPNERGWDAPFWGRAWIGRFGSAIAHLHYCAGVRPPLIYRLAWWVGAVLGCTLKKEAHDGWILNWHCMTAYPDQAFWAYQWVRKDFERALAKNFPNGGLGELLRDYFNDPAHPLVGLYWGRFTI